MVRARRRPVVVAAQSGEDPFALAGQADKRSRTGGVMAIVRTDPRLGGVKSRTLAFHRRSMWIVSAPGVKSRSGHRRASKFAGPHALMHGHVEIRGKGRWRQLVSQGDEVRDVGLGWRLHVLAPATLLEPQAGKLSRADRRPGAWPR